MSRLRNWILDLGDSHITAKFQRICGISINEDDCYSPKCNGNGMDIGNTRNGNAGSNGFLSPNGCDSSVRTEVANGHLSHPHGATVREDTPVALVNGSLNQSVSKSHQNGCSKKNGYAHTGKLMNGLNGVSCRLKAEETLKTSTESSSSSGARSTDHHRPEKIIQNGQSEDKKSLERFPKYKIENFLLYHIFSFGASLGNEVFYVLFFSFSFWNFDCFVVRKVSISWVVIMYIGQAAKDVIRWPRPKSPPVARLEERYVLEYGMPSTHAMVGVAIPFGMLMFMSGRYEFNLLLGILFAVCWSVLVSFSRLYLGMHSFLDILAGLVFAVFLMAITTPFVDPLDDFLMRHPHAVPTLVSVCLGLCLMYPSLDKWSTARGDTTLSLAVFSGLYTGLWMTGQWTDVVPLPDSPPFLLSLPSTEGIMEGLAREAVGVVITVAFLTTIKWAIVHGLSYVYGMDPKDPLTKQQLRVELPYKYVSYFLSAVLATYFVPILFLKLNIDRPGYYSEIFSFKRSI